MWLRKQSNDMWTTGIVFIYAAYTYIYVCTMILYTNGHLQCTMHIVCMSISNGQVYTESIFHALYTHRRQGNKLVHMGG